MLCDGEPTRTARYKRRFGSGVALALKHFRVLMRCYRIHKSVQRVIGA